MPVPTLSLSVMSCLSLPRKFFFSLIPPISPWFTVCRAPLRRCAFPSFLFQFFPRSYQFSLPFLLPSVSPGHAYHSSFLSCTMNAAPCRSLARSLFAALTVPPSARVSCAPLLGDPSPAVIHGPSLHSLSFGRFTRSA